MFLLFSISVSQMTAEKGESGTITSKVVETDLTIEFYQDGRVAPISNSRTLNEEQLNTVLYHIGYPEILVEMFTSDQKKDLVGYGGKVVNVSPAQAKHEYVSLDGAIYEVTPENIDKIREIQINDLSQLTIQSIDYSNYNLIKESNHVTLSNCNGNGYCEDGKWNALNYAVYHGETSTQYEYLVGLQYDWTSSPNAAHSDDAGMHWGGHASPSAGTADASHYIIVGANWYNVGSNLDLSSNHGVATNFSLSVGEQHGFLQQEIRINKADFSGGMFTISNAYQHPWIPNNWSLSIGYGGISFGGSIGVGDRWTWQFEFPVN